MTKDEALKLAHEALKKFHYAIIDAGVLDRQEVLNEGFTANTAIKKALALPQRTWVELTDEDRKQISKEANYHWEMTAGEYAERIGELTEAKLKEKNT